MSVSARSRELFRVDNLPVFQNQVFASQLEALQCPQGQVLLTQDLDTELIFNAAFQPELMRYSPDYQNEQSLSSAFQEHLQQVERIVTQNFPTHAVVEVGCGKGHFLEQLLASGFDIRGCDPTYEGTNPRIVKEYFSPTLGRDCQGVILRHVLEHIPDPVTFLAGLRDSIGGKAKVYIEVPCFDWICQQRARFDVFYEHVNYFRLHDLQRMFGSVYECGRLFGDQYLYLVADLSTLARPVYCESARANFPPDFLESMHQHAARLSNQQAAWPFGGGVQGGYLRPVYATGWGRELTVPVIDVNPAKQGKYLPATGILVSSPQSIPHCFCRELRL